MQVKDLKIPTQVLAVTFGPPPHVEAYIEGSPALQSAHFSVDVR